MAASPEPLVTLLVPPWPCSITWMIKLGSATHLSSPGLCQGLGSKNDPQRLAIHSGAGQCWAPGECSANVPSVELIGWAPQGITNHLPTSSVYSDSVMLTYPFLSTCLTPWNDPDLFTLLISIYPPTLSQSISQKKRYKLGEMQKFLKVTKVLSSKTKI